MAVSSATGLGHGPCTKPYSLLASFGDVVEPHLSLPARLLLYTAVST